MTNRTILSSLVAVAALATPLIASATTTTPKPAVAAKHHKVKAVKSTKVTKTGTKTTAN